MSPHVCVTQTGRDTGLWLRKIRPLIGRFSDGRALCSGREDVCEDRWQASPRPPAYASEANSGPSATFPAWSQRPSEPPDQVPDSCTKGHLLLCSAHLGGFALKLGLVSASGLKAQPWSSRGSGHQAGWALRLL